MAENGPFRTPFLTQKFPRKSLCGSLFLRSFPGNEAHKLFSGGPNWGVLGGGQKVYVEKVYVLFRSPIFQEIPKVTSGPFLRYARLFMILSVRNFGTVLGKTKTLQTVTLRVAILSDFSARSLSQNFGAKLKEKSAQVRAVFLGNLLAQNCHLQCYRFRCFSCAQEFVRNFGSVFAILFEVQRKSPLCW